MSEFKVFLIFLDTVTKAEAFVKNAIEYDKLEFRMEMIQSHLSKLLMIFDCIYRLPNVTKQQVERVTKITTDLISLKTTTWIAMQGNTQSPTGGFYELRRKGIHYFDSYQDDSTKN